MFSYTGNLHPGRYGYVARAEQVLLGYLIPANRLNITSTFACVQAEVGEQSYVLQ